MFALLKNKRGVTLVELLAVIVIMGIIAAIAIPTIGNLIENQRQNAAEAEWTSVLDAARLYGADLEVGDEFGMSSISLSATVTLTTDAAGTEVVAGATLIFEVTTGGAILVNYPAGETGFYINGYLVVGA